MQDKKLDFIVIGAQKCATSWMYYCLSEHPELSLPLKKQEAGYIGGEMYQNRGREEWFFKRFISAGSEFSRGDVSVDYLYQLDAPQDIAPYVNQDEVKFVMSLRDPVDRLISSYYWLVRRGKLPDLPLEEGIQPILKQKAGFPDKLDEGLEEIVRRGCYSEQIDRYVSQYGGDSVFPVLYENISSDGLSVIQSIYKLLGVKESFVPPSIGIKPKKNTYNRFFLKFERLFNNKIGAKISNVANQTVARFVDSKPELSDSSRQKLIELYTPEVQKLRVLFASLPKETSANVSNIDSVWNRYE